MQDIVLQILPPKPKPKVKKAIYKALCLWLMLMH